MTVNWTKTALHNLSDIRDYMAKDSELYAQQTVQDAFEKTDMLVDFPQIGKVLEDFGDENVRYLLLFEHKIIYEIFEDHLDILTVVRSKRNLKHVLGDFFNRH